MGLELFCRNLTKTLMLENALASWSSTKLHWNKHKISIKTQIDCPLLGFCWEKTAFEKATKMCVNCRLGLLAVRNGCENQNSECLWIRHWPRRDCSEHQCLSCWGGLYVLFYLSVDKGKKRKYNAHRLRPRQFWPFSWADHPGALRKSPLPSRPQALTFTLSTFHQSFHKFLQIIFSQVAILAARGRYKW